MRGFRGQHEDLRELEPVRTLLDLGHQRLAVPFAPEIRMHGQRGQLADALVEERVERRAADDVVVVFRDDEALDLALQPLARAPHEHTLLLERLDDRENAADVVDGRIADMRERRRGEHRAHAVPREELEQQRAVVVAAYEMRALHAVVARPDRRRQVDPHIGRELRRSREQRLRLACRQVRQQLPTAVPYAVGIHEEDELDGVHPDRNLRGDFLDGEVEDFAGGRIAERRNQHDVAVVEPLLDRFGVDAAHFTGQLHVDAVDDAHRLRGEVVAAGDPVAGTGHRRIREAEREKRLDARTYLAGGFEDAVHGVGIGHADAVRVAARDVLLRQNGLDLRAAAVRDDQPDPEAVQQVEIVNDAEKRVVGHHFAAERDDERLAAERVDIRRRRANPVDERAHRRGIDGRRCIGRAWHRTWRKRWAARL